MGLWPHLNAALPIGHPHESREKSEKTRIALLIFRNKYGRISEPCSMVGVAQLVRAPDCGSGGRRFDSDHPPHFYWDVAKR